MSISSLSMAQSPSDLTMDINSSNGFETVTATEASYNNARRQEEIQLGLPTNSIMDLDLPDQTVWDGLSSDEKALYLLNDERTARAGINYGNGAVKGLPFEGVGTALDAATQAHTDYLLANNAFTHCPTPTNCAHDRIDAAVGTSCQEPLGPSENLYASFTTEPGFLFPNAIAQGIYGWIYDDAQNSWGHRQMCLNQSFNDNYGDTGKAGILGIGVSVGGPFMTWPSGVVFGMNYFDPTTSCNETLKVDTDDLPGNCPDNLLVVNGNIASGTYTSSRIESSGTVGANSTVIFEAIISVELNENFNVEPFGSIEVNMSPCN